MLIKVKAELFGRPQLHEVVIERLLRDLDLLGGLLEAQLDKDTILLEAGVEKSPQTHLLDHLLDGALLDSGLLLLAIFLFRATRLLILCQK